MPEKKEAPSESKWAELREAQMMTLALPGTGMSVLIDGHDPQLHPRDKTDAGVRLGKAALAQTYGVKEPYAGPLYRAMKVEGGNVRLEFAHTDGGLVAGPLPEMILRYDNDKPVTQEAKPVVPGSPLQGFAVCGDDRQWKWAQAKIEGDSVVVSSPEVPLPVAVRYAWADFPTCNLYNGAGFPASPFRTDDFEVSTQNRK